jgi:Uma2 family endonuclease
MTEPAKRNATYADYAAYPEGVHVELIDGALYVLPAPAPPHGSSHSALNGELYNRFSKGRGGPGGWWFHIMPEQHLGPHVVQPDIAGWRKERMPTLPTTTYIEVVPDWVCEILSPSTERHDRERKRRLNATYGVKHLWYLHPVERYLEVNELVDGGWRVLDIDSEAGRVRAPPFEAIVLDLNDLWPIPLPPTTPPPLGFAEERTAYAASLPG